MTLTTLRTYPATVPESGDRCDGCAKYLLPGSVAEYRVVDELLAQLGALTQPQLNALSRAKLMLHVAGQHAKRYGAEFTSHYDEADCDGGCIADDCGFAIDELEHVFAAPRVPQEDTRDA